MPDIERNALDLLELLKNTEQGLHHTNYYHYTQIEKLDNILKEGFLRLSYLGQENSNDRIEKEWYKDNGKNLFSICFSTGTSESLPLWYLYSGIDGKGARIGLKKKTMVKLWRKLSSNELTIILAANDQKTKIPLKKEQYNVKIQDILYIGKDTQKLDNYRIKYNGQSLNNISSADYEVIKSSYPAFLKGLIWFYEKETRLQVEITDKKLQEKLCAANMTYFVLIDINCLLNDITVTLAPEFSDENEKRELLKREGFGRYPSEQLLFSQYKGDIKMGLHITNNTNIL